MTQPSPLSWVALLRRGVTPPPGTVEFRFLKSGAKAWMPYPTFEEHPDTFNVTQVPAGQDAYFGVAFRKDDTSGKADNCQVTNLVWVDVDLVDHPEFSDGLSKAGLLEATPEDLKAMKAQLLAWILQVCAAHDLHVRAAVDSGHGIQAFFARRYGTDHADTERFNKALALLLGGDPKSTDVARILRLPGTLNLKNPKRPLLVEVVHEDPEAWVEDAALGALPLPAKPEPVATAPSTGPAQPLSGDQNERYAQAGFWKELEILRSTGEGNRNHALNKAAFTAGQFIEVGALDESTARRELMDAALATGLTAEGIYPTINSGISGGKKKPRDMSKVGVWTPREGARGTIGKSIGQGELPAAVAATLPDKPSLAQYRDLTIAQFLELGHTYRYNQTWRSWWQYKDGVYIERLDEVMQQRVDLILQSYGYGNLKNAMLNEVLSKISREEGIAALEVDQTPWELNTRSGILDLESGALYDHTPDYFSTIQSAAHYRPEAVAHDWLAFLAQAVPDEGDRLLLQQFAGLCLTGDTSPQKALLLIGEGGTGKSTFVRILQAVLGNLATSSALESIKDDSFLIGRLVGKRMCVVSELQRNVEWLPFKRITGEDTIGVDVKNKTPFTTKLDIKLIILSNVMPFLGDDTSNTSLMRRFLPVAFNVKPEKPDPNLEARLTHPDELPGVLNWMLEGLQMLRANGMRFPSSDAAALAREIVEESNRVVTFLRDATSYVPDATTGSAELYTAYRKWCGETGHKPLSSTSFGKQLVAAAKHFGKQVDRTRDRLGRGYSNVVISTTPSGWEEDQ